MIIGLAGVKGSGKNTVAEFIKEIFGDRYEIKEWSFAEDLKKGAAASLGYSGDDPIEFCNRLKETGKIGYWCEDGGWPEGSVSGREYLQYYGTEAHRDIFADDFWVDNLMNKIESEQGSSRNRLDIITDVRFPNEARRILGFGVVLGTKGVVIKVRRPEVEDTGDTHASEIPLSDDLVNAEIHNTRSFDHLKLETQLVVSNQIYKTRF